MRRVPIRSLLLVTLAAIFAAALCPAQESPFKSQTFLSDYSQLKPWGSQGKTQEYVYVAPGVYDKFGKFNSVMVDQPEISLSPDSPYHSAKPDDLKAIAEFMRTTIVDRLKTRGYEVVAKGGEGVLYLRTAMTDVQLKKKKRGILAYTPVGAVVHGVKTAVQSVMSNTDIIDMAGQAEIVDSQTGEVLAAMVSRRRTEGIQEGKDKTERIDFDEFKTHVDEFSDRLACRLRNGKLPPEKRVDCTDAAARAAASGDTPRK